MTKSLGAFRKPPPFVTKEEVCIASHYKTEATASEEF